MTKNLRNALLIMAGVAILLAIIFNEFLAYAAIFVGAMIIFYGLYHAFLRTKDAEIDDLRAKLNQEESQLEKVKEENDELRTRKLNVSAIRQILDVGLFEIDTNFTRTWNEEIQTDMDKTVQFIGALKVNIVAKYGVDLKELRIKTEGEEVLIANMNLKSLAFTDLNYDWVISEVLEHKKPYLGGNHRRTNPMLELEANKIKERLQKRTHEEVKQGPEELEAITSILKRQLTHSIALLLGIKDEKVRFVEGSNEDFKTLESFNS
ncbi:MAG TPA: hypothetical protein VJ894_05810 [Cryomorphaceae bacterium]|nr:hypothetical protein [Cryomorphaceae bacterium]